MAKPLTILFTDLHLSDDTVDVCISCVKQIIHEAKLRNIKQVLFGGDAFNTRKSQSMISLTAFIRILDMFEEAGIQVAAIDGNHDKLMYNSTESYLDPFCHHPALYLVKTFENGVIEEGGISISMLSFFSDNNQCTSNKIYADYLIQLNKKLKPSQHNILITHHGFDGAKSNSGTPIASDLSVALLNPYKSVLVGHYHDESFLNKTIHYVGSTYQAWFSEAKKKGCTVINTDGTTDHIQLVFEYYTELDVVLVGEYVDKVAEAVKKLKTKYPKDYKRIHISGDKASIKSIDIHSIKASGIDVRVTDITNPIEQAADAEEFKYVNFDKQNIAGLFMEFLDEEGIVEDDDVEYGTDILRRVITNN